MAVDKTADAVDALHKTMVMLRQELAKKNHKIKYLEARLNNDLEVIQTETNTDNFEDSADEKDYNEDETVAHNQNNDFVGGKILLLWLLHLKLVNHGYSKNIQSFQIGLKVDGSSDVFL